ncbi:hypothetical protein SOI81_11215 [Acinetobacter pittii]|uniref:hypothetical protein n=1 Tax=Acinetobacter pittii TaxID=48296 RepID=UPI002A6B05AB|nr:hypothetical protein [Acinetobacter pittii]WPP68948.1 hypothetical protein SOI81_11215 [Acinetobacter pittii]
MRIFSYLLIISAAIIFYFSLKFGFDLKTAFHTLLLLVIWSVGCYFSYRFYDDFGYPKFWFYLIFGILLSFCFYPLLEFYSYKTETYGWLDWAGLTTREFRFDQEQRWFGRWYGLLGVTTIFTLISIAIQQFFDSDN